VRAARYRRRPMTFQPSTDELLSNNAAYTASHPLPGLSVEPTRNLCIVACMDSRMDIFAMLGLGPGEAHVIRNAGGIVTDDVIRSLVVSQRLLNTQEIILLHHTDCGLQKVDGEALKDELEAETGIRPAWAVEGFKDPFQDVRQSVRRLQVSPFILHKDHIRGFVFQVHDGRVVEARLDDPT
jgi:carbonic anhydrase